MHPKQQWVWEKVVLASHNSHKLREFRSLLQREFGLAVSGLEEFSDIPDVVEDGDTFEANAIKKASIVSDAINLPVIADDSGLVVDALQGAPGIYSARYAGKHGDDEANNRKLLAEMRGVPPDERDAKFVCALALFVPDGDHMVVHGECIGKIGFAERGTNGFGYDPLFVLNGGNVTMAELLPHEKDRVSHRAKAMQALAEQMRMRFSFD